MQKAGITSLEHPAAYYGLGLTIGNGEVRLLELTNAFASLARLGIYRPFRLLLRSGVESRDFTAPSHRVRLPAEYSAWLASNQNTSIPLLLARVNHLRILQPASGSFYFLDPDIPAKDQRLALRAESSGSLEWKSASLECRVDGGKTTVLLREGRHEIIALDKNTGETAPTWIEVQPW